MFIVAREFIREDGLKVAMRVEVTEDKVTLTYSLTGQEAVIMNFSPVEADYVLDLMLIQHESAGSLRTE